MNTDLQQRIAAIKTTALMRAREKMGSYEVINWWADLIKNTRELKSFDELDEETKAQILEWEAHPYKVIGT
jgi:hypothetical protein